jgi:hypothetical protein
MGITSTWTRYPTEDGNFDGNYQFMDVESTG